MIKKFCQFITIATLALYATPSSAQIFKLKFNNTAGLAQPLADALAAQVQTIENDINKGLPSASTPDRLMKGMANSSVMAGKGIGSDYASNMSVLLIGAGIGVGADLEKNKATDSPISGAGIQAGLLIGTNLGWMDTQKILGLETNRLNVYINGMNYTYNMNQTDTNGSAKLASYGMHFSYDWVKPKGSKLLGWGGVKIHTGFEHNSTTLKVNSKIKKDLSYTDATTGTYTSSIIANPDASIDVATNSIPLELSSSVQILYVLSLYGGLGADYNMGSATGKGNLNSQDSNVVCNGTCGTNVSAGTISSSANVNSTGKVNPFLYRGFAGVQVNLPWTRIFVQADKAFGNQLVGATAGVRFAF